MEDRKEIRPPEFKGEGIAVWVNYDKNRKQYLNVKILGDIILKAWKNEPKPEPKQEPEGPRSIEI